MGWKAAAISLVLSCSAMADATSTQALGAAGIDPTATRLNYMPVSYTHLTLPTLCSV